MAYNQTDIDVRLQLLGCKYAELASVYADDLKYGKQCAKEHKQTLILLEAYMEIIECYIVTDDTTLVDTPSTGTIELEEIDNGTTIQINYNGIFISGLYTSATTDSLVAMQQLADNINAWQTIYTATYDPIDEIIRLEGPCSSSGGLGADTTGSISITLSGMTEGSCDACSAPEILSKGRFGWSGQPGSPIRFAFFADGIPISTTNILTPGTNLAMLTELATSINSYQSVYTAGTVNQDDILNPYFEITGGCSNKTLSFTTSGGGGLGGDTIIVGLIGGVCERTCNDPTNCVTEEELDSIFDNISKLTGLCFQPKGFEYTPLNEEVAPSP